jgi:hypothetical protein
MTWSASDPAEAGGGYGSGASFSNRSPIVVDQHIAESDDSLQIGNLRGKIGVDAPQSDECLADDRELPFDGGTQHLVIEVIVQSPTGDELQNIVGCRLGIP